MLLSRLLYFDISTSHLVFALHGFYMDEFSRPCRENRVISRLYEIRGGPERMRIGIS